MHIIEASANLETATAISEIIVGNFQSDPMYADYDAAVLNSYVASNAPDRLLQTLHSPDAQCFIGEASEQIVGAVVLGHYASGYPEPESTDSWRIRRLHIAPAFRSLGYASQLLVAAESFVTDQGHDTIYAEPTPEAAGLLKRHGWATGTVTEKAVTYRGQNGAETSVVVPRFIASKSLLVAAHL